MLLLIIQQQRTHCSFQEKRHFKQQTYLIRLRSFRVKGLDVSAPGPVALLGNDVSHLTKNYVGHQSNKYKDK